MKHKKKRTKKTVVKKFNMFKNNKEENVFNLKFKIFFYAIIIVFVYNYISKPHPSDVDKLVNNFTTVSSKVKEYIKDNKQDILSYKTTSSQYCDKIRKYCSIGITNIDGVNESFAPDSQNAFYHIVIRENGKDYFNFLIVISYPEGQSERSERELKYNEDSRIVKNYSSKNMYYVNYKIRGFSLGYKDYPNIKEDEKQIGYFDNVNLSQ